MLRGVAFATVMAASAGCTEVVRPMVSTGNDLRVSNTEDDIVIDRVKQGIQGFYVLDSISGIVFNGADLLEECSGIVFQEGRDARAAGDKPGCGRSLKALGAGERRGADRRA